MGVIKSRKYILSKELIDIELIRNKKVAIDMMIYVIGFYISIKNTYKKTFFWHSKVLNFINFLISNNVDICCVYDGPNKHTKKYIKHRNKIFPTKEEIAHLNDVIMNTFKNKRIKILISDGEAESGCAFLLKEKKVDYIISDDSDLTLYNVDFIHISTKFDKDMNKYEYKLYFHTIKEELKNLSRDKINLACLLLGTDYTKSIRPSIVLELLKDGDMESFFNEINDNPYDYYMTHHFYPNCKFQIYNPKNHYSKIFNAPLLKI